MAGPTHSSPRDALWAHSTLPASVSDDSSGDSSGDVTTDVGAGRHGVHRGFSDDRVRVAREDTRAGDLDLTSCGLYAQTLGAFRLFVRTGDTQEGGWVEVADDARWGHGRALEVLALLLARQRALTRSEVGAALWPERDTTQRATLLRNALWNLRQALAGLHQSPAGEGVVAMSSARVAVHESGRALGLRIVGPVRRDSAGFSDGAPTPPRTLASVVTAQDFRATARDGFAHPLSVWCDVRAFEALAQRTFAAPSHAERIRWGEAAFDLYTGAFMPGVERSAWVIDQRARLEERWVQIGLDTASALRHLGSHQRAVELLLILTERIPRNARSTDAAMRGLVELGWEADALALYARYERAHRASQRDDSRERARLKRLVSEIRAGRYDGRATSRDLTSSRAPGGPGAESGTRWRRIPPDANG